MLSCTNVNANTRHFKLFITYLHLLGEAQVCAVGAQTQAPKPALPLMST